MICLECSTPFTATHAAGKPQRFCGVACKRKFNHYRESNGALFFDLVRIMRNERDVAKKLGIWTELCRVELAMRDREKGRKTWKPAEMALADIEAMDRRPTTNLYVKGK